MTDTLSPKQVAFYVMYKQYLADNDSINQRTIHKEISNFKNLLSKELKHPINLEGNLQGVIDILQKSSEYYKQDKSGIFSLTDKSKKLETLKQMVSLLPDKRSYKIIRDYLGIGKIVRSKLFPDKPYIRSTWVGRVITKEDIERSKRSRIAEYIHYVKLTNGSRSDKREMLKGVVKDESEIEEILNRELPIFD